MRPIAKLNEVEFTDIEDNGYDTSRRAQFSDGLGAKKLGYNLNELPPGKAQCPFHNHHGEKEMLLILEVEGELRFGKDRYPIRKYDVIACPTGGRRGEAGLYKMFRSEDTVAYCDRESTEPSDRTAPNS
jgi:uncharacterized cupin superfamily protein